MATVPSAPSNGTIPPEIVVQRNALAVSDPAPSQKDLSGGDYGYIAQRDFLGAGFSNRRVTINQRYEMRADAILAFAHFVSLVPLLTAKFSIKCRNPAKAMMLDQCYRRIHGQWVSQAAEAWNFGWQAQVKEFGMMRPGWQYIDPDTNEPKQVWDFGDIPMLVWEPFVNLRPETVEPDWDDGGHFSGIKITGTGPFSFLTTRIPDLLVSGERSKVPLENSLWIVHQRDSQFGSVWGWPRTAYAFDYWRAYKLTLRILERSVERKGDPLTIVTFPPGSSPWGPDQKQTPNQLIAQTIAAKAKAGTVLVMPYEVMEENAKGSAWDIKYVSPEDKLDTLVGILEYFDTMKFRSMLLSEQGLVEGKGGTSSRNVASVFGNKNAETQFVFQTELDHTANRYMIPQLSEQNMPWARDEPAEKVTIPFGEDGAGILADLIKSVANSNSGILSSLIDWGPALEYFNIPTLSIEAVADAQKRLIEQAAKPDPTEVKPDGSGNAAREKGTGLYYRPREEIVLAEDSFFLADLPPTRHFSDQKVLAQTRAIRKTWYDMLSDQYEDFATWLEGDADVSLSDVDLADDDPEKRRKRIVDRIVSSWTYKAKAVEKAVEKTASAIRSVFVRAGNLELTRASLSDGAWNPEDDKLTRWLSQHTASRVTKIDRTTRRQLRKFLMSEFEKDTNVKDVASNLRLHFSTFPGWRADLIAREETAQAYRAATLFAAQAAGGDQVQALDARLGPTDSDCVDRNGQFFTISKAFEINEEEHVRGTLAWRIPPKNVALSLERVEPEEDDLDWATRVDGSTIYVNGLATVKLEDMGFYLVQAVDHIEAHAR